MRLGLLEERPGIWAEMISESKRMSGTWSPYTGYAWRMDGGRRRRRRSSALVRARREAAPKRPSVALLPYELSKAEAKVGVVARPSCKWSPYAGWTEAQQQELDADSSALVAVLDAGKRDEAFKTRRATTLHKLSEAEAKKWGRRSASSSAANGRRMPAGQAQQQELDADSSALVAVLDAGKRDEAFKEAVRRATTFGDGGRAQKNTLRSEAERFAKLAKEKHRRDQSGGAQSREYGFEQPPNLCVARQSHWHHAANKPIDLPPTARQRRQPD